MAGFQSPITIHQAIDRIQRNEFLLPAFQREFVWSSEQIEKLFDSLMKGYPISSMLFWKVKGETKTDFKFYKFLSQFIERYKTHNDIINTDQLNDFHAILDGQQRLTSLYIGLTGSYAYHTPYYSWDYSERSFPTKHLYLNLSKKYTNEDDTDKEYIFNFLNKSETNEVDLFIDKNEEKWFKISRILSLHKDDDYDLDDFIEEHQLNKDSKKLLRKLDKVIHNENTINYYEEDEQNPDKAVNIFVRINSGGTHLSFSDILMSITIASWTKKEARNEIFGLVDSVNQKGFNISKDYILKSFLFLYHKDVRSKINSFNNGFIQNIEDNWEDIRNAILNLFDLMKSFGLNDYTLTTYNATLPILYYIYHKAIFTDFATKTAYEDDRKIIKKWIFSILIRRTFGGQGDTVLTQARKALTPNIEEIKINDFDLFPSQEINKEIKRITEIGEDYIEELLKTQKDSRYSFPILAMLYPDLDYKNNNFHQDHLHPASKYEDLSDTIKEKYDWTIYNSILNLQMLDANDNMSKNDMSLKDWVELKTRISKMTDETDTEFEYNKKMRYETFLKNQLIPNVDLELNNFDEFITERKKILVDKMKEILK